MPPRASRRGESDRRRDGRRGRGRRMTEAAAPIEHVRQLCCRPSVPRVRCLSGRMCGSRRHPFGARARRDRADQRGACGSSGGGRGLRPNAAGRRSAPLSARRSRPPRARRRRSLSARMSGLGQLVELFGHGPLSARTARPAAAGERGDNRRVRSPSIRVSSRRSGLSSAQAPSRQPSCSPAGTPRRSTSAPVQLRSLRLACAN